MDEKPSTYQIVKYSVLYILSESNEGKTCEELSSLSGFREKDIIHILNKLLSWCEIRKITDTPAKRYMITDRGKKKIDFFNNNKNYKEYWTPPWEDKFGK